MSTAMRHVVFDVGQVLLHWDPELAYLSLLPEQSQRQRFLQDVCSPAWNIEQDRGRNWTEAEAELIAHHPDQKDLIRAFRRNWHQMVPHALEENVAILKNLLDKGHDVTLLTNFAGDTFAEARVKYPFLDLPRGATVSGHVGRIKPEPEIYRIHCRRFELDPAAIFFVDDSPPNVEGAQLAGWDAVLYRDTAQLVRDLETRGFAL